ncbi:MAG: SDR family NAD(P)-dependent oxidoreductase [Lachnospiraceae bacterium]|nr:SDR family NAD(P)-dependent oxidoreductase [Lachnospiraceae bacterium]
MNRLKDKVAIVTGSTSGIGIAHVYAAEGAKVIVCGRRVEKGEAVAEDKNMLPDRSSL